jgi:hypothetical protein
MNYCGFYASDLGLFNLVEVDACAGGFMRHLLYWFGIYQIPKVVLWA